MKSGYTAEALAQVLWQTRHCQNRTRRSFFEIKGFRRGLAAKSIRLDIDPGEASWKTGVTAIRVARRTPGSVSIQEIFDECTTAHNDLHRNRGFSPWQLLLGKTPTDKTACEDPDLAQCSVELVDETAKQRLRVKEESYRKNCHFENVAKKFIKPDLGDIGQQVNGAGIGDLANIRVQE